MKYNTKDEIHNGLRVLYFIYILSEYKKNLAEFHENKDLRLKHSHGKPEC